MIKKIINKNFIIFFTIAFAVFSVWVVAFYPVVMTNDSISSWQQILTNQYSNWHPYLYTLFIKLVSLNAKYPVLVSLFQVAFSSFLAAFGFSYLKNKISNPKIVWFSFFLFIFSIPIGFYNVIMWKDIIFTQILVLWGLLTYIWISEKTVITNGYHAFGLGLLLTLLAVIRHNGIVFVLIIPAILFFAKVFDKKRFTIFLSTALVLVTFSLTLLPPMFKVNMDDGVVSSGFKVQVIGSIVQKWRDKLDWRTDALAKRMEPIIPVEVLRNNYNCRTADPLLFNDRVNANEINKEGAQIDKVFWKMAFLNIPETVGDRTCVSSSLILGGNFQYGNLLDDMKYPKNYNLNQTIFSQRLKDSLIYAVDFAADYPYPYHLAEIYSLLLRAYLLPLILFIYALFKYKKDKALFAYSLLLTIQLPLLFLVLPADDYRYLYFIYFGFFFLIPMAWPNLIKDAQKIIRAINR